MKQTVSHGVSARSFPFRKTRSVVQLMFRLQTIGQINLERKVLMRIRLRKGEAICIV